LHPQPAERGRKPAVVFVVVERVVVIVFVVPFVVVVVVVVDGDPGWLTEWTIVPRARSWRAERIVRSAPGC
jgi:hypothetical protein